MTVVRGDEGRVTVVRRELVKRYYGHNMHHYEYTRMTSDLTGKVDMSW